MRFFFFFFFFFVLVVLTPTCSTSSLLFLARFCSGSASRFVIHGNYLIFGQICFICVTLRCLSSSSALGGGRIGCSHFNLPVIKKTKKVNKRKNFKKPSAAGLSPEEHNYSQYFQANTKIHSSLTDNVPSSIFMKVLLNYMLWIMRLITEIGRLRFFYPWITWIPGWVFHTSILCRSSASQPAAVSDRPQASFSGVIKSQLGAKASQASPGMVLEQSLKELGSCCSGYSGWWLKTHTG